jgi:hypothetical protein
MTRETLLGLADRCEQATGPDRELDRLIEQCLPGVAEHPHPRSRADGYVISEDGHYDGYDPGQGYLASRYTASLDSAMTLVPEGWPVRDLCQWNESWTVALDWPERRYCQVDAEGKTAPLALCAAALKARGASL